MKGNPVSADFDELMNEGEMYSDSIREANEPVGSPSRWGLRAGGVRPSFKLTGPSRGAGGGSRWGQTEFQVNLKLGLTPMTDGLTPMTEIGNQVGGGGSTPARHLVEGYDVGGVV